MTERISHPMYTRLGMRLTIHRHCNGVIRKDGVIPAGFASIGHGQTRKEKQNEKQSKQQFLVHLKTSYSINSLVKPSSILLYMINMEETSRNIRFLK